MPERYSNDIKQQILRYLQESYPVKEDRNSIIKEIRNYYPNIMDEQISTFIQQLHNENSIEGGIIDDETNPKFKITSHGINQLQIQEKPSPEKITSQFYFTYDNIERELDSFVTSFETSRKKITLDMEEMRDQINTHEREIQTHYIRIIETFGVFVGIFAVVVIMMISSINSITRCDNVGLMVFFILWVPASLILVVFAMLKFIGELVVEKPQEHPKNRSSKK